ncbi:hypothetical protein HA466_0004580 [Hirschfeldia incana]|nr:hypothetical protein HA466_0004580 [Hirschfeldia incana]
MAMIKAFSFLKDLKPYKQSWRVQVKLLHSWRQKTNYGGDTLEMIFADETGVKIHCSARKTLIKRTENKVRLGEWRLIEIFSVSEARGQYRPTNHPYKMTIIEDTSIEQSTFECDDEFLNFPSFEEIGDGTLNTNFLIGVTALHVVFGKRDVQITTAFDSSMICFDPNLPECLALKQSVPNDEFTLALPVPKKEKRVSKDQTDDWDDVGIKPISEIIMGAQEEDCKIICSIESIDTDWGWFYFGHVSKNRCNKRCRRIKSSATGSLTQNDKPLFRCSTCGVTTTTVIPQFKLHLIVKDDTSTCKLMLLDSVAKIIVGWEADAIWDGSYEEIEDPDVLPQEITDLVGKSFCFGLALLAENFKTASDTFLVSQVLSGDKVLQIETNSEPITHLSSASSIMSGGEVSLPEKNDANSSEGSSTPFSKRKENNQADQNSTSKKLCTKVVKMEKIKDD